MSRNSSRFALPIFVFVFFVVSVRSYAPPTTEQARLCALYYQAVEQTRSGLLVVSNQPATKQAWHMLDPTDGTGYMTFDVTPALPSFMRPGKHQQFDWPEKGTFVFDGDASVPHYVDIGTAQKQLGKIIGTDGVVQMQGFGLQMLRHVYSELPKEEREKMHRQQVGLKLDLGEIRVCETTGCPLHIDWYPREGMVMIIPIYGDRTKVHHPVKVPFRPQPGHVYASLISAYGRWANWHAFDPNGKPVKGFTRDNNVGVVVPVGVKDYLGSRARDVPPDLFPNAPGVLPTVHQAGTGPRMVIVLNFSYRPLKGAETPFMMAKPDGEGPGTRSSNDAKGNVETDFHSLMRLLGYGDMLSGGNKESDSGSQ